MAGIRAMLLEAFNGKVPQHKVEGEDRFEPTEGSDGSLHTKDKEVKVELESIKTTQGQIIEALQATNESLLATNEHIG